MISSIDRFGYNNSFPATMATCDPPDVAITAAMAPLDPSAHTWAMAPVLQYQIGVAVVPSLTQTWELSR